MIASPLEVDSLGVQAIQLEGCYFGRWALSTWVESVHCGSDRIGVALSLIPDFVLRQELIRLSTLHPNSTARELAGHLGTSGLEITKSSVNSVLYSGRDVFWNDAAAPPRWQVLSESVLPPATKVPWSTNNTDNPFTLYAWQAEALTAWRAQDSRGVVEAVTGAGKTRVGLVAAWEELQNGGVVEVLVPSIELLNQWAQLVRDNFPNYKMGLLGSGEHDQLSEVDILIAVINSARNAKPYRGGRHALLIVDECHRYASEHTAECLDDVGFNSRLGLSATYERSDEGHLTVLDPFFEGTCFELDYARAIADEVTAHFNVALIGVRFNEEERDEYVEADERLQHPVPPGRPQLKRWPAQVVGVLPVMASTPIIEPRGSTADLGYS